MPALPQRDSHHGELGQRRTRLEAITARTPLRVRPLPGRAPRLGPVTANPPRQARGERAARTIVEFAAGRLSSRAVQPTAAHAADAATAHAARRASGRMCGIGFASRQHIKINPVFSSDSFANQKVQNDVRNHFATGEERAPCADAAVTLHAPAGALTPVPHPPRAPFDRAC